MKRNNFIFIILLLIITSCDDTNKISNPHSDEYIIDQTLSSSVNEQIVESGSDIKIIFPANSLKGNLELKIKKEISVQGFSVPNTKLGNNVYRIQFIGSTSFISPVKIFINYDKSKITNGKSIAESVKGFIYSNNSWELGDFQIDEINSKIIFNINNLANPKIGKDLPVLQENEDEILFGDGYTNTDSGQEDELLVKMKYFITTLAFNCILDNDVESDLSIDLSNIYGKNFPNVIWNSNKFSINLQDSSKYGYSKLNASGEINKSNMTLENYKIQYIIFDNYSSMSTHLEEYYVQFNEIKGIENVYGATPVWLTFTAVYNGSISQSDFKNAIKTIAYKITNYELNGTTINNEHVLKSVNWNNYTNQVNFNLYQVKQ
jgi:hypothetical protein